MNKKVEAICMILEMEAYADRYIYTHSFFLHTARCIHCNYLYVQNAPPLYYVGHCNYLQVQNTQLFCAPLGACDTKIFCTYKEAWKLYKVIAHLVLIGTNFLCKGFMLNHTLIRHPRQTISTIAQEHLGHRPRENLSLLEMHVYSRIASRCPAQFFKECFVYAVHNVPCFPSLNILAMITLVFQVLIQVIIITKK